MIENNDIEKLKTYNIQNILDLVLYTPISYENNTISNTIAFNNQNVVDASIISIDKKEKFLKVILFAKNFNTTLEAIIFNYKPFHFSMFKPNAQILLKGKIENNNNTLQLMQPKSITTVNTISVMYAENTKTIKALISKYITMDNLIHSGIYEEIAHNLYMIHFPTPELCNLFQKYGYQHKFLYSLKYTEIFNYITKLSQKRKDYQALMSLNNNIDDFLDKLPFELTSDQLKAISEIKNDLSSNIASKRIIVGDVGCGKTMVLLASAMMCYPHKAVLMAPTTILANQIYEEATKYLPTYVNTQLITAKTKKKINLENVHFIIGTHALLYQDLPQVQLVMIDEQHRFGTNQRIQLEQLSKEDSKKPHFLQFSATPIPRTMAMIDSSMVDFSFIKQIPYKKDISTYIISKQEFKALFAHIKNEITQNHQTIIVYPLVEESDTMEYTSLTEAKEFWLKHFENVYITHGKDKDKENILDEFKEKGNILLATTVIEVGISLPKLSTIVIVGAERLGLASLHQLRGRVSRNGLKGYCYLYTNYKSVKRLYEFANTTNGFEIAELDLQYRNSGDLLTGKNQSGKNFKFVDLSTDEKIIKQAKSAIKIERKTFDFNLE